MPYYIASFFRALPQQSLLRGYVIMNLNAIKTYLINLQQHYCDVFESEDGKAKFLKDEWHYHGGGGGITRVLTDGLIIEKAGVNFSHVKGSSLPVAATQKRPELTNLPFEALGVSVVV